MNASSGGSWRGGKKSKPSSSQAATSSSHRGWKTSKKSSSSSRKTNSKKLSQLFGMGITLLVLLGIAIWIFSPNYQLHTHFVLLNPLEGNARFPYEAKLAFPSSNAETAGRFTVGKHSQASASSLTFFNEQEKSPESALLRDADVCVIFFRAPTLPDKDQDHLVLLKNSTSAPETANQHELFSSLKTQLEALPKSLNILLLVDVNSLESDWRTGYFADSLHQELQQWSEELPNLTTIVSCDVGERSWSSGLPGWGGTVFEMMVEKAFSKEADQPVSGRNYGDNELTLREFYEYLSIETNKWVLSNRSREGQHVQIYPPLKETAPGEVEKRFLLMKSLPEVTPRQPENNAAKDLARQLPEIWRLITKNADQNISYAVPVLLAAAQSQLFSAELSLVAGRHESAKNLLALAQDNLRTAEQIAADSGDHTQITLAARDSLVQHTEIREWLLAARLNGTVNEALPAVQAGEILKSNLESFPFQSTGIVAPAVSVQESVQRSRERLEKTAALLFHDAGQFRSLLQQMQLDLLLVEDLLFINSVQATEEFNPPERQVVLDRIDENADLIEQYVLLKLEVEMLQGRLFEALPEIVEWAAGFQETPFRSELLKALRDHQPAQTPSRITQPEELQFVIVNALVAAEELLSTFLSQAKNEFNETDELNTALKNLRAKFKTCATSWEKLRSLEQQIHLAIPGTPLEKFGQSLNAARLPVFDERIRTALLTAGRLPWSEGEPLTTQEASSSSNQSTTETQFLAYRDRVVWESAWRLRLQDITQLTLAKTIEEASKQTQSLWDSWKLLEHASTMDVVHKQLYFIGSALREYWKSCRNQITTAQSFSGTDLSEYRQRLLKAGLTARLLRADDVDLWRTQREIQATLEMANQLEYCLLLSDLALLSQWVGPVGKGTQPGEKWYVQQASAWLTRAEQLILQDSSLTTAQEGVQFRRQKLTQGDKWVQQVDLKLPSQRSFEEQQQQLKLATRLRLGGARPEAGVASLMLVGANDQETATSVLELPANGIPIQLKTADQATELAVLRKFVPSADDCRPITLRPQIFFRGRVIDQPSMVVDPCPATQRTWQLLAGRESAEINVKGNDNRPIVFVLDWSASMNQIGVDGKPKQRHIAAANAVEQIIVGMPETMRVGLVIFGHSSAYGSKDSLVLNKSFEEAFKDFIDVKVKDPLEDVDIIHNIGLLQTDREIIKEKLNRLKTVEPYSTTPLALAMTTAAQGLSRFSNAGGTVVTITDGAPTDLGDVLKSLPPNPPATAIANRRSLFARRFTALEQALRPNDISAVLLALDFDNEDLSTLNCIFGTEAGRVSNADACAFLGDQPPLNVPIVRATGEGDAAGGSLRKVIDAQIVPRNFQVFLQNGEPVAAHPLKDTTILMEPKKSYQIRFGDINFNDIKLSSGDSLVLEMNWSKGRFDVKRNFFSHKSASSERDPGGQSDTPVTLRVDKVRKPSVNASDDFFETIDVDVMLDHDKDYRPVQKPEEIWFTLSAVGDLSFQPDSVVQEYTSKFGAPGWNFKISPWPRNRVLSIDAFWKMQRTVPDQLIPMTNLENATSSLDGVVLGGDDKPFPSFRIWQKARGEVGRQQLEIRIEPLDKQNLNLLKDLTVEIGETSILNENRHFQPDRVNQLKTIVDSGVVVFSFEYPVEMVNFQNKVLAITTLTARKKDAFQLRNAIQVVE